MIRTGSESDFFGVQQYCNYPEVSKNFKTFLLSDEDDQSFDSSSGLPSCTLDVSDTQSQKRVSRTRDVSPSLGNFLKLSLTSEEDEDTTDVEDDSHDSIDQVSNKEKNFDEEYQPMGQKYFGDKTNLDPEGWIKYASDSDPWNENLYSQFADENGALRYGILTLEEISKRSSNLIQLPDNKAFVFSRLHINKMDLEDISVMSNCRYFLYIDMSHNLISDLNGLNHCNYLMYLNASHNKIKKVLDFKPPWFLTHVNLCCNEIKEIGTGNISAFWSLKHLDLSYNLIEKIEGLEGLRYLQHLNLSHNYIQQVENPHCHSLQELNLSYNRITGIDNEDKCVETLENLRELNLAHNNLTSLHNLENLKSLKSLNVSENKITDFNEIYKLDGLKKLREIKMTGNGVCARQGYREFLIFKLSSLEVLDSVPVNFQERVASRMLWEPDVFTRKTHLRAKFELWNQLATQTVDITTTPYNDPPISLVALVGTFGSNKKEIAKCLEMKFPDQLYRCKQITNIPIQNDDDYKSVSMDCFNNLIKDGKLLFYYKEIGGLFGVGIDELSKCIAENKIGIIETTLEGALVLRHTACRPHLVLCVAEDTNSYKEKLNTFFTESNLWNRFNSSLNKCFVDSFEDHEGNETSSVQFETADESTTKFPTSNLSYQSVLVSETNLSSQQRTTNQSHLSDVRATTNYQDDTSDEFKWEWTYEPSVVYDVEPSESHQNVLRGRETFVQNMLYQQDMYVEMNNAHPSLFAATVYSDDVEKAAKQVGKTCCNIYNKRGQLIKSEKILDQPVCRNYVEARVQSLLKDLVNIPSCV